jgi:ferric-dicitrate binding protein FerR (iron transport regulator)
MGPMTDPANQGRGRQALEMLTDLARKSARPPTAADVDRGLQNLAARLTDADRRPFTRRWVMASATAFAVLLMAAAWWRLRPPPAAPFALSYAVEGGRIVEGGYLREAGHAGMILSFNEGTEFSLKPGTRARLRSVDSSGVRIAIESGTATFRVTPAAQRRWLVDVGPFLVTVKGTVFSVLWDASTERFELRLERGSVAVSGPLSSGDITLHAGQRLIADVASAEARIFEDKPPDDKAVAPSEPLPSERPAFRPSPAREAKLGSEHRWAEPLAAGRWDQILAEAERAGLTKVLETASSEDVFALADAARYRRRMELARQALLAERRRFPDSSRALDAAFLLGRVEESKAEKGAQESDEPARAKSALRWYDDYLSRAPSGAYAAEALGRKMILTKKIEGTAQAEPIAAEYLRRFPAGSYAGAARALWRAR